MSTSLSSLPNLDGRTDNELSDSSCLHHRRALGLPEDPSSGGFLGACEGAYEGAYYFHVAIGCVCRTLL